MSNLIDRIVGRLSISDPWVPLALGLAAIALAFAVFALISRRGPGGLIAMVLASLAAGAGIVGQVRAERAIDADLASLSVPRSIPSPSGSLILPPETRAQLERERRDAWPHAQEPGRAGVLAAILPLLLGAIAALRRPTGPRVLTAGFLAITTFVWLGAVSIWRRPLPLDRYDFAPDDLDAWRLAVALDRALEPRTFHLKDGVGCWILAEALAPYGGTRKALPPALEDASRAQTTRCVQEALDALNGGDAQRASKALAELSGSVFLQDAKLRARVEQLSDGGAVFTP